MDKVPADVVGNTRNDMYWRRRRSLLMKDKENDLSKDEATLNGYRSRSTTPPSSSPLGQDRGRDRVPRGLAPDR